MLQDSFNGAFRHRAFTRHDRIEFFDISDLNVASCFCSEKLVVIAIFRCSSCIMEIILLHIFLIKFRTLFTPFFANHKFCKIRSKILPSVHSSQSLYKNRKFCKFNTISNFSYKFPIAKFSSIRKKFTPKTRWVIFYLIC